MPAPTLQDLIRDKAQCEAQLYTLRDHPSVSSELLEKLDRTSSPADPVFAEALHEVFHRTPKGKAEYTRMDIDILRRAAHARETEQIFRAYGVLNLITPVRLDGKPVHVIVSGPVKVSPWTPEEKETLATLCGVKVKDLPPALDKAAVYAPSQVDMIAAFQQREADLVVHALQNPVTASEPEEEPLSSPAGWELLQPGFADHLDLLFSTIQKDIQKSEHISDPVRKQLQAATLRGLHVVDHLRQLGKDSQSRTREVSVHQILEKWSRHFTRQAPSLRLNLQLNAEQDTLHTQPAHLEHMLFTLIASVADGLPEGAAVMGLSTRLTEKDGDTHLHIEIRDGGGLATFAGIPPEKERQILAEQNEAASEFADWFGLASRMDATLKLLRDEGVVTRAELFIPLTTRTPDHPEKDPDHGHHIWIVEDNDEEYASLAHMLHQSGKECVRFTSAADLQSKFSLSEQSPDLVLLKYHLPDKRGAEVRSWLYEQDPGLPVVLISSLQATHPGIATANSLPSTLYLQKPFDSQALLDMIRMNIDDTLPG